MNVLKLRVEAQIDEALSCGLTKLAEDSSILLADKKQAGNYTQLSDKIKTIFWVAAKEVVDFHDSDSVDVKLIDDAIDDVVEGFIQSIEKAIRAEPKEEKDIIGSVY
jgi:hypothetical protein